MPEKENITSKPLLQDEVFLEGHFYKEYFKIHFMLHYTKSSMLGHIIPWNYF